MQNKHIFTIDLFGWKLILKRDYLLLEPPVTPDRPRRSVYLNLPSTAMRTGPDAGLHRIHLTRRRGKTKEHFGFDETTMQTVAVDGKASWPGTLRFRRQHFEEFAALCDRFVHEVMFEGLRTGTADEILADIVAVQLPPVEWFRRMHEATVRCVGGRPSVVFDEHELDKLQYEVAPEEWTHTPTDAARILAEIHEAFGQPSVMAVGFRVPPGRDVESCESLADLEPVRLFHHVYPHGVEVWQALPIDNLSPERIGEFWRRHFGPRLRSFVLSVVDAFGIQLDPALVDLDLLDEEGRTCNPPSDSADMPEDARPDESDRLPDP